MVSSGSEFTILQLIPRVKQRVSTFYRAMLMLAWKCCFKRPKNTSHQPTSSFSPANPITRTFKLVLLCVCLSPCADLFHTYSSSSTSSHRPSLAGEELCVGRMVAETLSSKASISHPGWRMKRTSSSGGWKPPHVGSCRGL